MFDQEEFNKLVLDNDVIGLFAEQRTLKSGRKSHFYANWRRPNGDTAIKLQVANHICEVAHDRFLCEKGIDVDCFLGVPQGATALAVTVQDIWAENYGSRSFQPGQYVTPIGREKPKEHGAPEDRFYAQAPKGNLVIIEDVTTTGGSLIREVRKAQELSDVVVVGAIGLTNRNEVTDEGISVEQALKNLGVEYVAASNALQLLPEVCRRQNASPEIRKALEAEFREYGTQELKLE